jgi:hypothetical protein
MTDLATSLPAEFAKVVACSRCEAPNLLRDDEDNIPQPGYVGENYEGTRVLLVGQNPGVPSEALKPQDRQYVVALRALRQTPTVANYAALSTTLRAFVPHWPVRKQYFPLEESGLALADIAYCNYVRCRTVQNSKPKPAVSRMCGAFHFERWLDLLRPKCVVFIGRWAEKQGGLACEARAIPYRCVNRDRSLAAEAVARNRHEVAAFVRGIVGAPAVAVEPARYPSIDVPEGRAPMPNVPLPLGPKYALEILNELERLGFDNEAFYRLHHFRPRARERISSFRTYCMKVKTFTSVANPLVVARLKYVLDEHRKAGASPGKAARFVELAEASVRSFPFPAST